MSESRPVKATIIGAGYVGATTAFALLQGGLISELVLIDLNRERAEGEAMDLSHAASLGPPLRITAGDPLESEGSSLVIFTAGENQKPQETRLDLVHRNARVVRQAIPEVIKYSPEAILLMVTNPVDVMTFVAWKVSGLPPSRVLGSGTVLDSARFRHLLATHLHIDPRNVHAHVIGEHGDSEVPVWGTANVAGAPLAEYFLVDGTANPQAVTAEIGRQVIESAYQIIQRKGATAYGVAAALCRICQAILRNENAVLTVSSAVQGLYGIEEEVCLSLPCVVNRKGRDRLLSLPLQVDEQAALLRSAKTLHAVIREIEL